MYAVVCLFGFCFFFFKQKTAYDMRISDWSSDVCSSDLSGGDRPRADAPCPWPIAVGRLDPIYPGRDEPNAQRAEPAQGRAARQIGRESCRERVCQYV